MKKNVAVILTISSLLIIISGLVCAAEQVIYPKFVSESKSNKLLESIINKKLVGSVEGFVRLSDDNFLAQLIDENNPDHGTSGFYFVNVKNQNISPRVAYFGEVHSVVHDSDGHPLVLIFHQNSAQGFEANNYDALLIKNNADGSYETLQYSTVWYATEYESKENLCLYMPPRGLKSVNIDGDLNIIDKNGKTTLSLSLTMLDCETLKEHKIVQNYVSLPWGFKGKDSQIKDGMRDCRWHPLEDVGNIINTNC